MIFGYARGSTGAQELTAQLKDLKAAGCERVFKEKLTGATADRPQLKKLLASVGHGDAVIIPAVDRLSRDTTDLLVIARDLQKAGAGLRSLAEPVVDTTSDFAELVLAMLGVRANPFHGRAPWAGTQGRGSSRARCRAWRPREVIRAIPSNVRPIIALVELQKEGLKAASSRSTWVLLGACSGVTFALVRRRT
jgi:hypothetical protein